MPEHDGYSDDQAQSEIYDETHIDDEGDGDVLLDEADPVLDVTRVAGDGERNGGQGPDEVELVYTGLMRNVRGAQASAAHWEAKRLSDDDIASLGYGPDGEEDHPVK